MKAFLGKFFWGLVSNSDDQVSTGAVLGIVVVLAWTFCFVKAQLAGLILKVGPVEVSALVVSLMGIPKAAAYLGKNVGGHPSEGTGREECPPSIKPSIKGGGNAPANGS